MEVAGNGDLLVTDPGIGVLRVDPATGNRTVVWSGSVGTGPTFAAPIGLVELPEPRTISALDASLPMLALLATRRRTA